MKRAEAIIDEWRIKLAERMKPLFVGSDYHEGTPKKCMNGWGNVFLTITPDGTALPCHTAKMVPGLAFPNVMTSSVREIWYDSGGFNRYRGTGWMKEPCVSCPDKEKDLGGCRCQAFLLANDPAAADPVCPKSPRHGVVQAPAEASEAGAVTVRPLVFRDSKNSRALASRLAEA